VRRAEQGKDWERGRCTANKKFSIDGDASGIWDGAESAFEQRVPPMEVDVFVMAKEWEARFDFLTNDLATYMYCLYRNCM
jgi:hypothetical protein